LVSYRQLSSGLTVLHERETSSSGRPKAQSLHQEDQYFNYEYDSRGGLKSKKPKSMLQQYQYWHKHNVKFAGGKRITPLTEFEKQMGVKLSIQSFYYKGRTYTDEEWTKFRWSEDDRFLASNPKIQVDWGALEVIHNKDLPKNPSANFGGWGEYFKKKASEKGLITVSIANLHFKEKDDPAVVEKIPTPARPNPREVKKVEPVTVEPIKEVAKYSPLMIAGVIAVVVILLLKRRGA
jgi:hypothetical protein